MILLHLMWIFCRPMPIYLTIYILVYTTFSLLAFYEPLNGECYNLNATRHEPIWRFSSNSSRTSGLLFSTTFIIAHFYLFLSQFCRLWISKLCLSWDIYCWIMHTPLYVSMFCLHNQPIVVRISIFWDSVSLNLIKRFLNTNVLDYLY